MSDKPTNQGSPKFEIALFRNAMANDPVGEISLSDLIGNIKSPSYKRQVEVLREHLRNGNRKAYDANKKHLPSVTLSARCDTRAHEATPEKKNVVHSGWLQADCDFKDNPVLSDPETVSDIRSRLIADPHIGSVFVGPSGEGIKAAVRIDPERHRDSWFAAEEYFQRQFGLRIDKSTKDPMRLCFVSHDPLAMCKEDAALVLPIPEMMEAPSAPSQAPPAQPEEAEQPAQQHAMDVSNLILLPSGTTTFTESAETVFSALATTGRFYLRGGAVMELREGALDIMQPDSLRSAIETTGRPVCEWRKGRDGQAVLSFRARASRDAAQVWMKAAATALLPTVKSVCAVPPLLIGKDGHPAVAAPGFDAESGTLVVGNADPAPTDEESAAAVITRLLEGWDFVSPADRSRAIAAILTPALAAGGLIQGHFPLFAVEADDSQAGKGYLCELITTLYGEVPDVLTVRAGGVGGLDESLASALVRGKMFVQLDNVRGKMASQFLEAILTVPHGGTIGCRVPHRGEAQINPSHTIFMATSNGLEMTTDLANRACIIRIRIRRGWNPPDYPEGDLIAHVAANRDLYLGAVYSLLSSWIESGRPRTADTRSPGRFRVWGQVTDWICRRICGTSPLEGVECVRERVASPGLVWLREIGQAVLRDNPDHEPMIASRLVEVSEELGLTTPGNTGGDARKVGMMLGHLFGTRCSVAADDLHIDRAEVIVQRIEGGAYLAYGYSFRRSHANSAVSAV